MIRSECGTWRIEWGLGSPRPNHFMLYLNDDEHTYMGTYLTLSAAMKEAGDWHDCAIMWGHCECERGLQVEDHAAASLGD